jgi:hypothetical protein
MVSAYGDDEVAYPRAAAFRSAELKGCLRACIVTTALSQLQM